MLVRFSSNVSWMLKTRLYDAITVMGGDVVLAEDVFVTVAFVTAVLLTVVRLNFHYSTHF